MSTKVLYYLAYYKCKHQKCNEELEGKGHSPQEAVDDLRELFKAHLMEEHGFSEKGADTIARNIRPTRTDTVSDPGTYPKEPKHATYKDFYRLH